MVAQSIDLRFVLFIGVTFFFLLGGPTPGHSQDSAMPVLGPGDTSPEATVLASLPPDGPTGILSDSDGGDHSTIGKGSLRVFTVAGTGELGFAGDGGLATKARLWFASSVAVDGEGNVFIADSFNNRIRRVDAQTGAIATVAGTGEQGFSGDGELATEARLNSPSAVILDDKGNMFVADTFNNRVRVVEARTGIIYTYAGTGEAGAEGDGGLAVLAQLNEPAGLALDGNGNLLIADRGNHRICKIDRERRIITTVVGSGVAGASGDGVLSRLALLNSPTAITVDAQGDLIVADTFNNRVLRMNHATEVITTVAGTGAEGFDGDGGPATKAALMQPTGVAVDPDGTLYIADTYNGRIRRVDAKTGVISTLAGTGERGSVENGIPAGLAPLNAPMGLAKDPMGNLLVADSGNHSILRLMP